MPKQTFAEAREEIYKVLKARGWEVTLYSRGKYLKVPYATSPDGLTRYWFKTQAVYVTEISPHGRHDFKEARSAHVDIREGYDQAEVAHGHRR